MVEREAEVARLLGMSGGLSRRAFLTRAALLGLSFGAAMELLAACGTTQTPGAQASSAAFGPTKYRWRTATSAAAGSPSAVAVQNMCNQIYVKTNGAVRVDLFPNSQLGAEADYIKGLQDGTIQINWSTSSVFTTTIPELLLFNLPYVYKSADTVHKAINGPAKQQQEQKLAAAGIHILSWGSYGFRHVGAKEEFPLPDMHGDKIRTLASPLFTAMFKLFNAVPTPLNASDVYSALQQGVVSGYDITLSNLFGFKWYEVAGKITRTFHSNAVFFVGVNKQLWDTLPTAIQTGVAEAAAQATADNDALQLAQEAQAVSDLQAKGATVLTPDLTPWRAKITDTIWPQFASQVGGMSVINQLVNSQ